MTTYLCHARIAELSPNVDRNDPQTWVTVLTEAGHTGLAQKITHNKATPVDIDNARWHTAASLQQWW